MTARETIGLLALALGCLAVGEAILAAAGLVPDRLSSVRAAGLAFVVGWATTGLLASFLLMAGLSASAWQIVVAWMAIVAAAATRARRLASRPRLPPRMPSPRAALGLVGSVVAAGYLAALFVRSLVPLGTLNPDAWTQWLAKAKVIYFLGGLDAGLGGFTHQINSDYPPLHPSLEATSFRFAGDADFLALPFFHWMVLAAFVGAVAHLLRPRASAALVWWSLVMLLLAPKLTDFLGSSLADEPLSLLIGLAGVTGTLWLMERQASLAMLAALFLAAAALTKNEGLMLGLVLAVALCAAGRRRSGLVLVAAPLLAYVPWRIWLHVHGVPPNFGYDFARLLDPGELLDRTSYLSYGMRSLLDHLFSPREWLLIVPASIALAGLAALRRDVVAVVGLGVPIAVFFGYSGIYWIGNGICTWMPGQACDGSWRDIEWLVGPSADRIVASVAVLLASIFPLLAQAAGAERLSDDRLAAESAYEP